MAIDRCEHVEGGCLAWVERIDCAARALACNDEGEEARCVSECEDACSEGATRCNGAVAEACAVGPEGCLAWRTGSDCLSSGQGCEVIEDEAVCVDCTGCGDQGATRCADNAIMQSCLRAEGGCLEWVVSRDCSNTAQVCNDAAGSASCVGVCEDECSPEGAVRCSGLQLEACSDGESGCLEWLVSEDCGAAGQICVEDGSSTGCTSGPHGSCSDPVEVAEFPFAVAGADFAADFSDSVELTGEGCLGGAATVEAVFAVVAPTGRTVVVSERGALDVAISALEHCEGAEPCMLSRDAGEVEGLRCESPDAGMVYVVVEAVSSTPLLRDYEIVIDLAPIEECGSASDEDLDGLIDCDDPDCFGDPTYCTVEESCTDRGDNDADGATDCEDPDCAGPDCECAAGIVTPITLPFTAQGDDFLGTFTDDLALFGVGCVTRLDQPEAIYAIEVEAGETLLFREADDNINVVFSVLESCGAGAACAYSSPIDTGWLDEMLAYTVAETGTAYVVVEVETAPSSSPAGYRLFIGSTEECGNAVDDDLDGATDCGDEECFGNSAHCAAEVDCFDREDNDMDGAVDCDDPDCAGGPDCTCDPSSVIPVTHFPFSISGDDFPADFTEVLYFAGEGCWGDPGDVDAVFQVDLEAGQTVQISFLSKMSFRVIVQRECGTGHACDVMWSAYSDEWASYTAAVDETVFVIVEEGTDWGVKYEITITDPDLAEDCGNVIDDDGDSYVDCDDPTCFGAPTECTAEINCGDGRDNDLDGLADCLDGDCGGRHECQPERAVYEVFTVYWAIDLAGHSLSFTPDATEPNGFTWADTGRVADFPEAVGTGTVSTELVLDDDDYAEVPLATLGAFPWCGETYSSLFVSSNGYVSFGGGSANYFVSTLRFFGLPNVSAHRRDLDPSSSGTVTVDEHTDRVVVTFDGVPGYEDGQENSFQIVLWATGAVDMHFVALPSRGSLAGVSCGSGNSGYPAETDFVP